MLILETPIDYSANGDHSYLFGAARELQLASYGPKLSGGHRITIHMLLGFSRNNSAGRAHIVRPHPDY